MTLKCITGIVTALTAAATAFSQPADRQLWNQGWTFTKDAQTKTVDLPHDWGVEGDFNQNYPGGAARPCP